MTGDPYLVLGVSPSATEAEIKAAYRKLAKQYHPDVNGSTASSEAQMKRINEAYAQIMQLRKGGAQSRSYGGYRGGPYQGEGYGQAQEAPELTAARNYIGFGRYREALNALSMASERNALWHYLSARANLGLGNTVAALSYAQQAVRMEPGNPEYREFLAYLEGDGQFYQQQSQEFGGMPTKLCRNPCFALCLLNMVCNCLCNCCGGGGFRRGFF